MVNTYVKWEGHSDVTAAEGMNPEKDTKLDKARTFLIKTLADGRVDRADIEKVGNKSGHSWATVRRAAKLLKNRIRSGRVRPWQELVVVTAQDDGRYPLRSRHLQHRRLTSTHFKRAAVWVLSTMGSSRRPHHRRPSSMILLPRHYLRPPR
jgi:hypothetical protein